MRLWSLHPGYLDAKGLTACWREGLLAKAVISKRTKGYRHHPQLERFRLHPRPVGAVNEYLSGLKDEASRRGYAFDARKIAPIHKGPKIPVTAGQARYELSHLKRKLWRRDRRRYLQLRKVRTPLLHPLFRMVRGGKESWER